MPRRLTLLLIVMSICLGLACASGSVLQQENDSSVPETVLRGFVLTPSPARDRLLVRYELLRDVSDVSLQIYDTVGNFVRGLSPLPTRITGGVITAWTWDLKDFENRRVPSGAYLARLQVRAGENDWRLTRTLVVQ